MRIFYQLGQFISHVRAGQANMQALATAGHELVDDPARADVAILHDEPLYLLDYIERLQGQLPIIAYCVVETDPMPPVYVALLRKVDEVWTCSDFSRNILARAVENVHVVPHVVTRPKVTKADMQRVQILRGNAGDIFNFYTICDGVNPRKNLAGLLRAFVSLGLKNARLIVKQYRHPLDFSGLLGVVSITEELTDGEIGALHASCDCYVSAHCAEAWGLGMSEAMSFGNPVVATGYSGNMEFMTSANSLPVRYAIEHIRTADLSLCPPFFTPDMRWAYVDETDLAAKMRQAMRPGPELLQNASRVTAEYGLAEVGRVMNTRLKALVGAA